MEAHQGIYLGVGPAQARRALLTPPSLHSPPRHRRCREAHAPRWSGSRCRPPPLRAAHPGPERYR
jgi:hypothetical protein